MTTPTPSPTPGARDLVVCDYCSLPHPLNDDGRPCKHPRPAPPENERGDGAPPEGAVLSMVNLYGREWLARELALVEDSPPAPEPAPRPEETDRLDLIVAYLRTMLGPLSAGAVEKLEAHARLGWSRAHKFEQLAQAAATRAAELEGERGAQEITINLACRRTQELEAALVKAGEVLRSLITRDDFWAACTRAGVTLPVEYDDVKEALAALPVPRGEREEPI